MIRWILFAFISSLLRYAYCEVFSLLSTDNEVQNASTYGFIARNTILNCEYKYYYTSWYYGGASCFNQLTYVDYFGPINPSTGQLLKLLPHYEIKLDFSAIFRAETYANPPPIQISKMKLKAIWEDNFFAWTAQSCIKIQRPNESFFFLECSFSATYQHSFDVIQLQFEPTTPTTGFGYFWAIRDITITTSECTSGCLICSASSCEVNSPTNGVISYWLYNNYLKESEASAANILNRYCKPASNWVFVERNFVSFVGNGSNSLMSQHILELSFNSLPIHNSIYLQFKIVQKDCNNLFYIQYFSDYIPYKILWNSCQAPQQISLVYIEFSYSMNNKFIQIVSTSNPIGIREVKVIIVPCPVGCTVSCVTSPTVCDVDDTLLIASFLNYPTQTSALGENWNVYSPLYPGSSIVTTCAGKSYLGGYNKFNVLTKVTNQFRIAQPHYSAIITFKLIKTDLFDQQKVFVTIDGIIFQFYVCDGGQSICQSGESEGIKEIYIEFSHRSNNLMFSLDLQYPNSSVTWGINDFKLYVKKCHPSCTGSFCTGPSLPECQITLSLIRSFFSFTGVPVVDSQWSLSGPYQRSPFICPFNPSIQMVGGLNNFDQNAILSRFFDIKDSFVSYVISFEFYKFADWTEQLQLQVNVDSNIEFIQFFTESQAQDKCMSSTTNDYLVYRVRFERILYSISPLNLLVEIYTQPQPLTFTGHWGIRNFQMDIFGCPLQEYYEMNSCTPCPVSSTCLACTNGGCFSSCDPSCLTCFGESMYECSTCDPGFNRTLDGSMCRCNDGYFSNTGVLMCSQCDQTCKQCSGPNINQCTFCEKNNYRTLNSSSNKCECVERFYEPTVGAISCSRCNYTCLSCNGPNDNQCVTCSLDIDKRQLSASGSGRCECIPGYFEDPSLKKCLPCALSCKTCVNSATNCLVCEVNRIAAPLCDCDTSNKFWLDGGVCQPCHSTCQSCLGFSYNDCLSCQGTLYLNSYQCLNKCPFFELFGERVNSENVCVRRCSNFKYQKNSRNCCPDTSETCYDELTYEIEYPSKVANKPNSVNLKFSRPFRIEYAQKYSRIFVLQMENIDQFTSSFSGLDESNGFVQIVQITAEPQQSVLYSNLMVTLLVDYIRDYDGIPQSRSQITAKAKFGKTEYIPKSQVEQINQASSQAQQASKVVSYLGAAFYFLNACQLLDIVVDIMQWSSYYIYLNVEYPINVNLFFSTFNSVKLEIDIFSLSISSTGKPQVIQLDYYLFKTIKFVEGTDLENQEASEKFSEQGVTSSFMLNGGSFLITLIGFFVCRQILNSIHGCFNSSEDDHSNSIWCQLLKLVKNILTFGPIIKFIQSSFFQLIFAFCLQIKNIDFSNSFNMFSAILAFATLIAFIAAAFFFTWRINHAQADPFYDRKYDSLYRYYDKASKWQFNFSVVVFIKKCLLMAGLVLFQSNLKISLIIMGSIFALFALYVLRIKPYKLTQMNDYQIISEFFYMICLFIVFQIQECNNQINSQDTQSIDQNIINKKLFLGWWLIYLTLVHIVLVILAICKLLWKEIKEKMKVICAYFEKIWNIMYRSCLNRIEFKIISFFAFYFPKSSSLAKTEVETPVSLPDILKNMKDYHQMFMDCSGKGVYQLGEFVFVVEKLKNPGHFRALVYYPGYQEKLHAEIKSYFEDRKRISKHYAKRYENNILYNQVYGDDFVYSDRFTFFIENIEDLVSKFSGQQINELYNILTYRNYWNFIQEDNISENQFEDPNELSQLFLTNNRSEGDTPRSIPVDFNDSPTLRPAQAPFQIESAVRQRIKINRCACQYCQQIFYERSYINSIDWKVFYCLKSNYMKVSDLINILEYFDIQTVLMLKHLLNERLNLMESGSLITSEEIENAFKDDSFNQDDNKIQPVQRTKKEQASEEQSLDLSLSDKPNLKKSLINSKDKAIEMTNIKVKSSKGKDGKQMEKKDRLGRSNLGTMVEDEEEEEEVFIERMVRFKLYKWEES